jgi:UDP-N-acetylmuramate-alanine ligase
MILHVMHYHDIAVDYMVGAQLEGFDTMVHLTEENDFIVLEGDEYLSSLLIEDLNSICISLILPNFRNCLGPY